MNHLNLKFLLDEFHHKVVIQPSGVIAQDAEMKGFHACDTWGDRRFERLRARIWITSGEQRYLLRWDRGGYFTKTPCEEWVATHGDLPTIGRILIRKNLSPEMTEEYGPVGSPFEAALMLPEAQAAEVLAQIRMIRACGLTALMGLTIRSKSLPRLITNPADLDLSGDVELPICEAVIEDYLEVRRSPPIGEDG